MSPDAPAAWWQARGVRTTLAVLGYLGWLAAVTWRLADVPGLDLDEAWSLLSAWGEWEPADPLSGMTRYSGPFPVLLLELWSGERGWLLLRGVGVLANGLALFVLSCWFERRYPDAAVLGYPVPFVATLPLWLVYVRSGIETAMFGPFLALSGLYLVVHGGPRGLFAGGALWGVAAYNHVLGAFVPLSLLLAWLGVYRRLPRLRWLPLLAGFALGVAPRVVALVVYADRGIEGTAAGYRFGAALADLLLLPGVLAGILTGDTVYLRFVGRAATWVAPYWLLALAALLPWFGRFRAIPKSVRVALLTGPIMAVLIGLFAPKLACNYFIAPCIAFAIGVVELGAAGIVLEARFAPFVRGAFGLMIALNLGYLGLNYYRPWSNNTLAIARFALGHRNPRESNYPFLPKTALVARLRSLSPQQILATPTLERPLRVLLAGNPVHVSLPANADPRLRSVLVAYREGDVAPERCVTTEAGDLCFARPIDVDGQYLVYRQ